VNIRREYDKAVKGSLNGKELRLAIHDWLRLSASANLVHDRSEASPEAASSEGKGETTQRRSKKGHEEDGDLLEQEGTAEEEAMSKTLVLLNELELVFAKGGRSGPGGLEVDEFIGAYKKLGIDDASYFEEMFMKIDVNNDGILEWREFINFMLYSNMAQLSMHENDHSQEYIPRPLPSLTYHRDHSVMQMQRLRYIEQSSTIVSSGGSGKGEKESVLISTSTEGSFKIWNASNLSLRQTVQVGNFCVTDVVGAEWLNMLVATSIEGAVSFYRFDNPNMRMHRESLSAVPLCVTAWTDGGLLNTTQNIAVGDDCGGIHIWRYKNSDKLSSKEDRSYFHYRVHSNWITQIMYVPSLQYLVSASQDSKISLYNIATREEVRSYTAHAFGVNAFAYSTMYRTMFSVGAERVVYVWNVIGCTTVTKMLGHLAPIISVTIRENYNQLVTQSSDHVVRIWDAQLYHAVQTIDCCLMGLTGHYPLALATAHPTSSSLIVCTHQPMEWPMRQYDPDGQKITSHETPLVGAVFVAQWSQVVSVSMDSVVNVWDLNTGLISLKFMIDTQGYARIVSVSIDDTCRRLITGHIDGTVCTWNTSNGECLSETACGKMPITALAYVFSAEEKVGHMWAGGQSECIHGFRDIVPAPPHTRSSDKPRNHPGSVMSMASLSNDFFMTGCNKGVINVWSVRGTLHCTCKVGKLARPPSAASAASAVSEGTKRDLVYQLRRGAKLSELNAEEEEDVDYQVYSVDKLVSLLNHGHIFVSSGSDGRLRFWDYAKTEAKLTGTMLHSVATHYDESDNISQLATNALQNKIVTSNEDGLIKVWSCNKIHELDETGVRVTEVEEMTSWRSHSLSSLNVINGPKDELLITTGHDMTVAVWTIAGAKIGVFGQWTLWDINDVKTYIEPNPRIALAVVVKSRPEKAKSGKEEQGGKNGKKGSPGDEKKQIKVGGIKVGGMDIRRRSTRILLDGDRIEEVSSTKRVSIAIDKGQDKKGQDKKGQDKKGQDKKGPSSPREPLPPPNPPNRDGNGPGGSPRVGRGRAPQEGPQSTGGGSVPKLPQIHRRLTLSNKCPEEAEALEDLSLLESLQQPPTDTVRQASEKALQEISSKELVDKFLHKRSMRAQNHMREISKSRYTTNYLWHESSASSYIHDLSGAVKDEFGSNGYIEEKKRGRKPFLPPKRERQFKALRDAMKDADGSSRREGGLLNVQKDVSNRLHNIGFAGHSSAAAADAAAAALAAAAAGARTARF